MTRFITSAHLYPYKMAHTRHPTHLLTPRSMASTCRPARPLTPRSMMPSRGMAPPAPREPTPVDEGWTYNEML